MLFNKVKQLCEEKGISIYRLEKETGLSKGSISKWGESEPAASKLYAVAKLLGTTVEKLLDDESNGKTKEGYKDRNSKEKKGE